MTVIIAQDCHRNHSNYLPVTKYNRYKNRVKYDKAKMNTSIQINQEMFTSPPPFFLVMKN